MTADRPAWPAEEPDAETLIRFYIGEGQFSLGLMNTYVKEVIETNPDPLLNMRYIAAVGRMQHSCEMVVLLKAAVAADPVEADRLARLLWCAADAGDWYGEMLWEWATDAGLDPEAIHADGTAAAKAGT